jgi:hypothetical protein
MPLRTPVPKCPTSSANIFFEPFARDETATVITLPHTLGSCRVEILGRCRPGWHKDVTRRLQCGLRFLAEDNAVVVRVDGYSFNVQDCIDLRNFTVHGDKPHPRPISLHPRFVPALKDQIADGLDRFRRDLADDPNARHALAAARLVPIFVNSRDSIFIRDVYPMARRAEVGRMHE